MEKKLLSQKQVAEIIGVHPNTIKNWREAKLLTYFRAPGSSRCFYFKDDVDAFIEKNTVSQKIVRNSIQMKKTSVTTNSSKPSTDWRIE